MSAKTSGWWAVLMLGAGGMAPPAQELLWQRTGDQTVLLGGRSVPLGDLDGDGVTDFAHLGSRPIWFEQQIHVLSGRIGTTLRVRDRPPGAVYFALMGGAGDVNRDGVRDYVTNVQIGQQLPGSQTHIEICDGRSDVVLWQVAGLRDNGFGGPVLSDIDLDGDRQIDLVVAAPRENNYQGAIYAYASGGRLLYRIAPVLVRGEMGRVGDVDGDGCDEFVVGTFDWVRRLSVIQVYSGRVGRLLSEAIGIPGLGLGHSLGCGDVDADGVPDFMSSSGNTSQGDNAVEVFSSRTQQSLYRWLFSPFGGGFGRAVAVADLDRDGMSDLLVGSGQMDPTWQTHGTVYWYSLRDGSLVRTLYSPGLLTNANYGLLVDAWPGEHFPVFVCPDGYRVNGEPVGRINCYRAAPPGVHKVGGACRGTLPAAPLMGFTDLSEQGGGKRLHLSGAPAGAAAVLLLGLSRRSWGGVPLPFALDGLGFPGCRLHTSVEVMLSASTGTVGTSCGYASIDLPLLAHPLGIEVHGQWLVAGRGATWPGALSEALVWPY